MKTLPTSSKDYEASGGTHLANLREVSEFIRNQGVELQMALYDDNRKILPKVLGPKGAQWTGFERWDVWKIEVTPNTQLFILSGKNGSSLEVQGDFATDVQAINRCILELGNKIIKARDLEKKTKENPGTPEM